jgi:hypothetical protein
MPLPGFAPEPGVSPSLGGFSLLLAPAPQLSGDGQLRELMLERFGRFGDRADLWYLPPLEVRDLALGLPGDEAVVAGDPAVATWLQIRFGGRLRALALEPGDLRRRAATPPAGAPQELITPG